MTTISMKQLARSIAAVGVVAFSAITWGAEPSPSLPASQSATTAAVTNVSATPTAPAATNTTEVAETPREPVEWDPTELYPRINVLLRGGRSFERGEKLFLSQQCVMCHRFGEGSGGIGPDISGAGNRFDTRELLESIVEPSKIISDIYGAHVYNLTTGKSVTGKPVSEDADIIMVAESWTVDPKTRTSYWPAEGAVKVKREEIDSIEESPTSPMITGLLSLLNEPEIADLLGFLISGGNPDNRIFKPAPPRPAATPPPAAAPPANP